MGGVVDVLVDLGFVDFGYLEREVYVLVHCYVWVKGVVLEHYGDVLCVGW